MLSRIFLWRCANIRACSRLFLIVDLRYVITGFKAEKMASLSAFVTCESKSNLTILLIRKLLFRDISCNFLIMVLITIASLSLSSNKLGNNVNNNLLMPLSLLLIWNRKVLSCNCLAANNNFWCCQEIKMWISGTLFEKKEIFFWHSDTCRFLNKCWTLL